MEALLLYETGSKLNGPMHGLVEYAQALHIVITCDDTNIYLETPLGHKIDICTDHISHYKYVLTETCRYALMEQLNKRVNYDLEGDCNEVQMPKRMRKDMKGITPVIDTSATLAVVNHKIKEKYDDDTPDVHNIDPDCPDSSDQDKLLCKPCKLEPRSRRRLQTIIAGSVRPPHRLIHTGHTDTSKCKHPECNGAKCDGIHLFWQCSKFHAIRRKYLDCLERKISYLNTKSKERAKKIRELLNTTCFKLCGICPANSELLMKAARIDVPNPHREPCTEAELYHGEENATTLKAGEIVYSKVYTDGSCREGNMPCVARAGWGVFYAHDSPHNFSAPLDGPTQTSYRAELKAVLHVVRKAVTPTIIMCDCQSVVKTLANYIENGTKPDNLREQDLWDIIFNLTENVTSKQICIQWMPGHLDNPNNAKKRDKYLKDGIIEQQDIVGNVAADTLANTGADAHVCIKDLIIEMHDKRQVTILIQKMLLDIWEAFINDDPDAMEANQNDIDEIEKMLQNAQLEAQMDDDYDPWAQEEEAINTDPFDSSELEPKVDDVNADQPQDDKLDNTEMVT